MDSRTDGHPGEAPSATKQSQDALPDQTAQIASEGLQMWQQMADSSALPAVQNNAGVASLPQVAAAPVTTSLDNAAAVASLQPATKRARTTTPADPDNAPPPVRLPEHELRRLPAAERRRYERNLREQQRSYRISQQIKVLRDVLSSSNVPFKPNKFSILVSVADYIKELQARAIMLDADHKRLVDTIRRTSTSMNNNNNDTSDNGHVLDPSQGSYVVTTPSLSSSSAPATATSDEESPDAVWVQGVDFRSVFRHCPYPLGVSSLDGRILACNTPFERLLGPPTNSSSSGSSGSESSDSEERSSMLQQSLFLYIRNHQEIFEAMADLLKRSSVASETGQEWGGSTVDGQPQQALLYWSGQVVSSRQQELAINITLTGMEDGTPKFFSFSMATSG